MPTNDLYYLWFGRIFRGSRNIGKVKDHDRRKKDTDTRIIKKKKNAHLLIYYKIIKQRKKQSIRYPSVLLKVQNYSLQ